MYCYNSIGSLFIVLYIAAAIGGQRSFEGQQSGAAVVHSPTGAFEPVRGSRHNSQSDSARGGASRSSSLSEPSELNTQPHQHLTTNSKLSDYCAYIIIMCCCCTTS